MNNCISIGIVQVQGILIDIVFRFEFTCIVRIVLVIEPIQIAIVGNFNYIGG